MLAMEVLRGRTANDKKLEIGRARGFSATCIILTPVAVDGAHAAPKFSTKTVYYTVPGSTPKEMLAYMRRNGPHGNSGRPPSTSSAHITQSMRLSPTEQRLPGQQTQTHCKDDPALAPARGWPETECGCPQHDGTILPPMQNNTKTITNPCISPAPGGSTSGCAPLATSSPAKPYAPGSKPFLPKRTDCANARTRLSTVSKPNGSPTCRSFARQTAHRNFTSKRSIRRHGATKHHTGSGSALNNQKCDLTEHSDLKTGSNHPHG